MGRLTAACLALLLGAAVVAPTAAHAQDPAPASSEDRAKELYNNGVTLYDEGRYEDAIAAWEAAYELSGKALLLFNIANAWERIGEYDRAIDALSRYRAFAPADEKELLDRRMRNLERRIAERDAATISRPADVVTAPVETAPVTTATTSTVEREGNGKVGGWVLAGVGAATLTTGAIFGASALGTGADIVAACTDATDGMICTGDAADLVKRRKVQAAIADVGVVLGVATLGTGLTLALLTSDAGGVGLSPTVGLHGGGMRLDASF
jgi:tetratricopeptide (TPR) repeat protein